MIKKHIEVVTIDTTGMKETAFGTVETSRGIYEILDAHYTHVTFNVVSTIQELEQIALLKPDLAVLCVKYIYDEVLGKEVWLSDFFADREIAFTGSNRSTLRYDSDKALAKRAVFDAGLRTARFFMATPKTFRRENQLPFPFPLFVKPMDAANGNGIDENSLVHDFPSYLAKVDEIYSIYGVPALVETYLSGREFTVAVLDDPSNSLRLISPVEIIVPVNIRGDRILGCLEKSRNNEQLGQLFEPELSLIKRFVDQIFTALKVQDFGRIDIKMDDNDVPYFMEANLVPGMTPVSSYFPRACFENYGMSYKDVVLKIVSLALVRAEMPAELPPTDLVPIAA
ncbi:hypothetical protein [Maritalea sp.]|uniref:hypothetical protein n=1 Tax=Maritalea sp. TaxID=2003361 RepID=UPI003EF593EB